MPFSYEAKPYTTSDLLNAAGSFSIPLPYCDPVKGHGVNLKTLNLQNYEFYKPFFFIKYPALYTLF